MALTDLFKKNEKVSIEKQGNTVLDMENIETLVDVAKNSEDVYVCLKAADKLMVMNEGGILDDVMNEIVNCLTETGLAVFVNNATSEILRAWCVVTLTNQTILASIANNNDNGSIRYLALKQLTDQSILAEIAKNHRDARFRERAVENLTEQVAIADVVKNGKFDYIHVLALSKLTDQSLIADIDKNNKAVSDFRELVIREQAMKKITDIKTDALKKIMEISNDENLRNFAEQMLKS